MKTCLVVLSLILAIEGYLAWAAGMPQLSAMLAGTVLVGGLSSLWKRRGGEWSWAPLVGLYVVGAVLVFGFYRCGLLVAMSSLHFVAWFYAARGIRFGAPELLPGTLDGRPGIFAIAFYGSVALAFVLVRGGAFPSGDGLAVPLAFILFVLGLVVMEKGRFLRLREGAQDRASRKRGVAARALAGLALLALMFFVFAKPVPVVADGLVTMALDLQGKSDRDTGLNADDMPDLDDVPERDPTPGEEGSEPGDATMPTDGDGEQRAGDSMSKARKLPQRADLHGSHIPVVHLKLESPQQAAALASRPIYVRSSTLGQYADKEWRRVGGDSGMAWIKDRQDGAEDGRVSLPPAFPRAQQAAQVRYRIYIRNANGAGLLSLQGVSEFDLPRVMRYGDDWYRAPLIGNITYKAVSRPLALEDLLEVADLKAGRAGAAYIDIEPSELTDRMKRLMAEMPVGTLAERLMWLKQFFITNYAYSSKIENPDSRDPLENFLFYEKRGYCDFFSTAGALMVRMMGIPSRIGYGYSKGEFDGDSIFSFHADEAHSWTEIYLEGQGWVVFDVTPSEGERRPPAGAVRKHESPDLTEFEDGSDPEELAGSPGLGEDEPDDFKPKHKNSAISDLVLYVLFCVALVAFALWYFLKRDPEREAVKAEGRSAGKARKLPAYLAEFVAMVRAFGLDPQQGETIVELMRSLRGAGVPVDGFEAMKQYHYATRYAGEPLDPKMEKRFLQEVKSYLKEHLRSRK